MTQIEAARRIRLSIIRQIDGEIPHQWPKEIPIDVEGPDIGPDGIERVLVITGSGAWLVNEDGSLQRPILS